MKPIREFTKPPTRDTISPKSGTPKQITNTRPTSVVCEAANGHSSEQVQQRTRTGTQPTRMMLRVVSTQFFMPRTMGSSTTSRVAARICSTPPRLRTTYAHAAPKSTMEVAVANVPWGG